MKRLQNRKMTSCLVICILLSLPLHMACILAATHCCFIGLMCSLSLFACLLWCEFFWTVVVMLELHYMECLRINCISSGFYFCWTSCLCLLFSLLFFISCFSLRLLFMSHVFIFIHFIMNWHGFPACFISMFCSMVDKKNGLIL